MTGTVTAGRHRLAALLLSAVLASCSSDSLTAPTSAAQLDGTWRLFQMTSGDGVHNEDLTAGRFNVVISGSTLTAKADCNSCSGTSTLSGATLTIGPLGCTFALCASESIASRFTGLLTGALTVRVNDRLLQLNDAQGGELRFEK